MRSFLKTMGTVALVTTSVMLISLVVLGFIERRNRLPEDNYIIYGGLKVGFIDNDGSWSKDITSEEDGVIGESYTNKRGERLLIGKEELAEDEKLNRFQREAFFELMKQNLDSLDPNEIFGNGSVYEIHLTEKPEIIKINKNKWVQFIGTYKEFEDNIEYNIKALLTMTEDSNYMIIYVVDDEGRLDNLKDVRIVRK